MKRISNISGALLLFIFPLSLSAQDWPQFRGPERNSKLSGFSSPVSWPAELKQVWKVKAGQGDSSPVLAGDFLYLHTREADKEVILCLSPSTGELIWKNEYLSEPVTGSAGSHPGPRGTPSVAEGKLIAFGASGIISCLDAVTGEVLWRKENPDLFVPQFFTGASPLIYKDLCFIHTGTKDKGLLQALDINTGKIIWKWEGDGPSYSSPSVMNFEGETHLIIHTEKNLCAFGITDGKIVWQVPTPVQQRFYNCTSPLISGNIIYITGAGTGTMALEVFRNGTSISIREKWNNPAAGAKWCTPVLVDGNLYGFNDQRRIYCIRASDGTALWVDNVVNSDFATIIDAGDALIGLPSTGNLLIFKANPAAYTEIMKYKVAETPVYSFPLLSGNKIYVKDAEHLTLFRISD